MVYLLYNSNSTGLTNPFRIPLLALLEVSEYNLPFNEPLAYEYRSMVFSEFWCLIKYSTETVSVCPALSLLVSFNKLIFSIPL